ncbi:MAG: uroporphyrinogen-III synthase [Hydrogenophilales bacterium 16-64-46]|nr:MAG: uroporphyrinogen-III synthase [Hydrogenophilales bacterium 12-64-13]OYZ05293.1 MAG: uroporphyrinogen-III synthase [Hydrogenophilales bacterium 16-64-46]OZA37107.1 MAG: uroporphyrinogen-III synthase [Hydrogenophilales bacterium 17-64-34]HQS99411.1 uroporphyrinogen-III synthase [Thiobacillus sp.]
MTASLAGRAVLVTRPAHQAASLAQAIEAAGGEAIRFPALAIDAMPAAELAAALAWLREADAVIFISPNAAQFGMAAIGLLPAGAKVFAVGPGTARELAHSGQHTVIVPDGQDSEALLALPELAHVGGQRIVIVRGVGGRPFLADTLKARGAEVRFMECYRRVRPQADAAPLLARWQAGGVDAVTVASAETLANLLAMLGEAGGPLLAATPLFAPHEKIVASARSLGLAHAQATAGGDAGLVDGMIRWFNTRTNT